MGMFVFVMYTVCVFQRFIFHQISSGAFTLSILGEVYFMSGVFSP